MNNLPPGRDGMPLVGETLSFARNPFRFIEERLATHGRIFRSNVLGRKAVVVAGPEAAARFIDPNLVMREGSMPPHVQELFGGRSLARLGVSYAVAAARLARHWRQLPRPEIPGYGPPERLPVTVEYREGADVGYRDFVRRSQKPLFPFGYGQSYTTFSYGGLEASGQGLAAPSRSGVSS